MGNIFRMEREPTPTFYGPAPYQQIQRARGVQGPLRLGSSAGSGTIRQLARYKGGDVNQPFFARYAGKGPGDIAQKPYGMQVYDPSLAYATPPSLRDMQYSIPASVRAQMLSSRRN